MFTFAPTYGSGKLAFDSKLIDVGTTVQTTVSAKAAAEKGLEALLERLKGDLAPQVRELQKPLKPEDDAALAGGLLED